MSDRLLIKSVMCTCDQGVFEPEERNAEGDVTKPRKKIQDRIKIKDGDTVEYDVDKNLKKLKVKVNGKKHELPIDDYSLSLAGRD